MNGIKAREHMAARKIQKRWKKHNNIPKLIKPKMSLKKKPAKEDIADPDIEEEIEIE